LVDVIPAWPPGAEVVVVPGLPGRRWKDGDEVAYPVDAVDFVKLTRESGLSPAFARSDQQSYVDLKAGEHWLPVFVVAEEALAAGAGTLLADVIRKLIRWPPTRRTLLHVRVGRVRTEDAEVEFLEAAGDAGDVLEAMERFLERDDR
jgi:hypothetical protein